MAIVCIPKNIVDRLKNSAIRGEINLEKIYNMSSAERREYFTKFTDKEVGKFLNTEFEKAKVSQQQDALLDWAKSVFNPQEKAKPMYKNVLDKIKQLDEIGVLTPSSEREFLEDLVADKLGISVTPEEVGRISELAKNIQSKQEGIAKDLGSIDADKGTEEFFVAVDKMNKYLREINPQNRLRILTGTVGRGSMLFSLKSPLMNIESNTITGILEALQRRIRSGRVTGADSGLVFDYVKMVNRIYQRTGFDISRMMDASDLGAVGERVLGSDIVHAEGKGIVRKAGQVAEDIVFKQLMGAPDVAFSAAHFGDSINLNSMKMAKGDKTKAIAMMKDAMRIKPLTADGELLRSQAILDAQYATYTNAGWASKISLGIRKILNDATGDLRAGDYVMPFVKTPAELISLGIKYAGGTLPKDLFDIVHEIRKGDLGDRGRLNNAIANTIRAGFGLTLAAIITNQIGEDDFSGAYDPARAQIEGLRNSGENMIRVGNKWYSLDYLGPIGAPVTAMLFAKKYGNGKSDKMYQYVKGVASQLGQLPGVDLAKQTFEGYKKAKPADLKEAISEESGVALDQIRARLVPSIVSDIAKASDKYVREAKTPIEKMKAGIPGLRQTLEVKNDIFGEPMTTESPIWTMVAGSRVKTAKDDQVVKELNDLYKTDNQVALVDFAKTTRKKINELRDRTSPEHFTEIKVEYGKELKKELSNLFNSEKYARSYADNREKMVREKMDKVINHILKINR